MTSARDTFKHLKHHQVFSVGEIRPVLESHYVYFMKCFKRPDVSKTLGNVTNKMEKTLQDGKKVFFGARFRHKVNKINLLRFNNTLCHSQTGKI